MGQPGKPVRIVLISDTHGRHRRLTIPDGELLIHAGDFTSSGVDWSQKVLIAVPLDETEYEQVSDFNAWLGELPHKNKIVIAGNHDLAFLRDRSIETLLTNAIYLRDSECIIDGFKIYGSPWTPRFKSNSPWVFETSRDERAPIWSMIPDDVDILVTHGPPNRILDTSHVLNNAGEYYAGDVELAARVHELRQLKLHVFGHIHSSRGERFHRGVMFVNAAVLDHEYQVRPEPVFVFEVNKEK